MNEDNINKEKISAVIPSNNNSKILFTIDSIKKYVDEIIIVSSANNNSIIPKANNFKVILTKSGDKVNNAAKARNIGAQHAKNKILLFIDADVELNDEGQKFLENISKKISFNKIFSGLYTFNQKVNLTSNILNQLIKYRLSSLNTHDLKSASSSHFLIYKDFFQKIGGFNENLNSYEDVDFFTRAQKVLDAEVRIDKNFLALHNKEYNFFSLLRETFIRTFNFVNTRIQFKSFYKNIPSLFDWRINIIPLPIIIGFIILLTLKSIKMFMLFFFSLLLINSFFTIKIFGNYKNSFFGNLIISITGIVSYFSALLSIFNLYTIYFFRFVARIKNLTICLLRVCFKYGKPIQLIQYVTARCNLRCDHCFYKETLDRPDPGELSVDNLVEMAKQSGPLLWYSLAGGEPFIRKDFSDIVLGIKNKAKPVVISLPTNGWYTDKTYISCLKIMQKLNDGLFVVFISIDGNKEIHDKIRGENSFKKLSETFDILKKLSKLYNRLHVNIVITVQDYNYQCFPELITDLYNQFDPTSISINLFRHHELNGPKVKSEIIEGYESAVNEYEKIRTRKSYGLVSNALLKSKEKIQKDLILTVAKQDKFVTPCSAGNLSYVSMEDGSLKPCEILKDNLGFTNKTNLNMNSIFYSKEAKELRKKIKNTKCKCTYECAMSTNVLFNKDMFPSIIKQSVKDFVKK